MCDAVTVHGKIGAVDRVEKAGEKAHASVRFVKASRPILALDRAAADLHTRAGQYVEQDPNKAGKNAPPRPSPMTAAEATVESMLAHGIDTIYALPGVQNDYPVRGPVQAPGQAAHGPHPPRTGRGLHGARRGARDRSPQAYAVVPGPGLLNSRPPCSPPIR